MVDFFKIFIFTATKDWGEKEIFCKKKASVALKVAFNASVASVSVGQFTLPTKLIKPKLSCRAPPTTQHHSFYRNPPSI